MGKKGVFGLSFSLAFKIVAALIIGVGLFTMTQPLLNRLADYGDVFTDALEINRTEYEQVAKDSAHGMRVALSCTAIMNAQNPDSDTNYISYLEEEWETWEGGVCQRAADEGGVVVGEEDTFQDPVTVECEEPDFGSTTRRSCEVHNFNLPNDFGGFGGPDNVLEDIESFLRLWGEPRYFLYYQSFPNDYGIDSDWDESLITDDDGSRSTRFWTRTATNFGSGIVGTVASSAKLGSKFVGASGSEGLLSSAKANLVDMGTNLLIAGAGRDLHEGIYGIASMISSPETAEDFRNNFIVSRANRELNIVINELGEDYTGSDSEFLEYNSVVNAIQDYILDEVSYTFSGHNYPQDPEDIGKEEFENFLESASNSVEGFNADIDNEKIARDILDNLFEDDEFFIETIVEDVEKGYDRAQNDLLNDADERRYYQTLNKIDDVFAHQLHPEEEYDTGEVLSNFIDNYYAMEDLLGETDSETLDRRISSMKTTACGSGAFRRFVEDVDFDGSEVSELEDSAIGERCEQAVSDGDFCGVDHISEEEAKSACIASSLVSSHGLKEISQEIRGESVGINSLGLKRAGPVEPIEYELHPVANWYYVALEHEGGELTGPGRRFYSVSPCRTEASDEDEESYVEVSHGTTNCYMGPEDIGAEIADSDFVWADIEGDEEEMKEALNRIGRESIPTDVFFADLQGSFYHRSETFENIPFVEGYTSDKEDILYTENPYVYSVPEFYHSNDFLTYEGPSGTELLLGDGGDIDQEDLEENVHSLEPRTPEEIEEKEPDEILEEIGDPVCVRMPLDYAQDQYPNVWEAGYVRKDIEAGFVGDNVVYCDQEKLINEGWNTRMFVENPSDPNAPGIERSDVRDEVEEILGNLQYLDHLKIRQYEEYIENEDFVVGDVVDEAVRQIGTDDFKKSVWSAARSIPDESMCNEEDILVETYECEIGTLVPGTRDTEYTCDIPDEYREPPCEVGEKRIDITGDEYCHLDDYNEPQPNNYTGGDIISWDEYCTSYVGNASKLRDYFAGGEDIGGGDQTVYYSQLGYWGELSGDLNENVEEINELVDRRKQQMEELRDREDTFDVAFSEHPDTGEDIKFAGHPDLVWGEVHEYADGFEGDETGDEINDMCNTIYDEYIDVIDVSEGIGNSAGEFYVYPVCEGQYDGMFGCEDGNPGLTFSGEHDVDGSLFEDRVYFKSQFIMNDWLSEGHTVEKLDGGDTIEFEEYCQGYLSNIREIENAGVNYRDYDDGSIAIEGVYPNIPDRYISSQGQGTQRCIDPSMASEAEEILDAWNSPLVSIIPFEDGVTREVDSLTVRYENKGDHMNYCYSTMDSGDVMAEAFVSGGSVAIQAGAWKFSKVTGVISGGTSFVAAAAFNWGVSMVETYAAYSLRDQAEWPHGEADWDEGGVRTVSRLWGSITDLRDAVANFGNEVEETFS